VAIDVRNSREQPNNVSGTLQSKKTGGYSLNYQNPIAFQVNGSEQAATLRGFGHGWQGQHNTTNAVCWSADKSPTPGKESYSPKKSSSGQMVDFSIVQSSGVRRLTPTECERLQGFPDGWTGGQSDSARYRQLGNAVAVPCAEWIAKRMMNVAKTT
jgi:site-specific DNA-cytosine methylase